MKSLLMQILRAVVGSHILIVQTPVLCDKYTLSTEKGHRHYSYLQMLPGTAE